MNTPLQKVTHTYSTDLFSCLREIVFFHFFRVGVPGYHAHFDYTPTYLHKYAYKRFTREGRPYIEVLSTPCLIHAQV